MIKSIIIKNNFYNLKYINIVSLVEKSFSKGLNFIINIFCEKAK